MCDSLQAKIAILPCILTALNLSETYYYQECYYQSQIYLSQLFLHMSLEAQAKSMLLPLLPKIISTCRLKVQAKAYMILAQILIALDESSRTICNYLKMSVHGLI